MKDEVPGSSPVGGDRWCIMSLAMKVGGLEVVYTKNYYLFIYFNI
jgi:hypothetical protein